jgi:hypothetical protein
VDSYLDKTESLNKIVIEIQRLLGDPQDDPLLPLNLSAPTALEIASAIG